MQLQIDAARPAFVVHDGDVESGSSLCDDETFVLRKECFDAFAHPFVFVPGDNEWTDCHRANNGGYDPLERLARGSPAFELAPTDPGYKDFLAAIEKHTVAFASRWRWCMATVIISVSTSRC